MGQRLKEDKIGTLSHSSGTISVAASILTIGGQQYVTSALSRLISTDVTLIAATRYMVYAVISGGNPALRISTNVNSVGPAGFASWKLVGAFYSDGMSPVAFGSFVNIEGVPSTSYISYQPVWASSGTQPTLGNGTLTGKFKIWGDTQEVHFELNGGSTTSAGTGGYTMSLPLATDAAKMAVANPTSTILSLVNSQYGNQRVQILTYNNPTSVLFFLMTDAGGAGNIDFGGQLTATSPTTFANGHKLGARFQLPVAGITNIPLKDL